ncbi:hypothetical protein EBR78_01525 [bacterium]|nr:hypothetical protein [bacterium]
MKFKTWFFLMFCGVNMVLCSARAVEAEPEKKPSGLAKPALSALVFTPSLETDTFNRAFSTAGFLALFSLPITQLAKSAWLHAETGMGISYSRVELPQPNTQFSRLEFPVPFSVRLLKAFNKTVSGELLAGVLYRPFFYDSRESTNGGFQSMESGQWRLEGGVGLRFQLSPALRLRVRATRSFLASGVEFLL